MMINKKIFTLLFFFLFVFTNSYAMPGMEPGPQNNFMDAPPDKPPMMFIMRNIDIMNQELKLNDKQISEFETINLKYEKIYLTNLKLLAPLQIEIKKLSLELNPNYEKIKQLMKKTAPLIINLEIAKIKHFHEIQTILNSRQRLIINRLLHDIHFKTPKKYQRNKAGINKKSYQTKIKCINNKKEILNCNTGSSAK